MTDYICIGVPYFLGERVEGRDEVDKIKASSIVTELGASWVDLQPDFAAYDHPLIAVNNALAQAITQHPDKVPLIFAADCTSCLGALKGLEAEKPAVLWYDAHGDFNTEETSPSGFLGGMPLAWLVGDGNQKWMQAVDLAPIDPATITITDARDLDPEEAQRLEQSALQHLSHVEQLQNTAFETPLYIHMDTDVVDISEMPGMSYPAGDGPSVAQVAASARYVYAHTPIKGLLFSLWNNTLTKDDKALTGTLQLVRALTGLN
jgi:arginase